MMELNLVLILLALYMFATAVTTIRRDLCLAGLVKRNGQYLSHWTIDTTNKKED